VGRGEPGGFDRVFGEEGEEAVNAHGGAEHAVGDVGGVCGGDGLGVESGGVRGRGIHQLLTASMSTP
jgi:hypothetical protein